LARAIELVVQWFAKLSFGKLNWRLVCLLLFIIIIVNPFYHMLSQSF
jgi:hypothetical protein